MMTDTKQARFIFLKKGHKHHRLDLSTSIHKPTLSVRTIFISLLGAILIVYMIGFAFSYNGHYLSPFFLVGLFFLVFLPLYSIIYDLLEESVDPIEYAEDESKNDVIIDTVGGKLIIHDTKLKEDLTIDFEDIEGFDIKIDVDMDKDVKAVWTAWVYFKEESHLWGASEWKEDLEDLIEKIEDFLKVEMPEEKVIDLFGDSYQILGVTQEASLMEVKKAYRGLAKKYHPDIGGDEEIFKTINEAYQSLIEVRC